MQEQSRTHVSSFEGRKKRFTKRFMVTLKYVRVSSTTATASPKSSEAFVAEVTIRADQQLFCVMNGPLRHWANLGNVLFGTLGTVPKFIYKTKTMLHVFDLNFSP